MKRTAWITAALLILCLPAAGTAAGLKYIGSSTIGQAILEKGAVAAYEKKTGNKMAAVENPGSGKGIKALMAGETKLAGASRSLKRKEKKAGALGHTIGYDAIAVFIHKDNPVKDLTKDQIKGIFTGEITNWKDVGGNDAPITPNTEIAGEGRATMLVFQKITMGKAPYGKGFKEIDMPKDQIVYLAGNPTGICSVSLGLLSAVSSEVKSKVKSVSVEGMSPTEDNIRSGGYLISRPLLLVTKGLAKGEVKEFIDFMLTSEGQSYVAKHFVPVKR